MPGTVDRPNNFYCFTFVDNIITSTHNIAIISAKNYAYTQKPTLDFSKAVW